ncbi:hypothetical protein CSB45_09595 [candidate division KSB3 bacterium]|uniref:PKD domain-containing protein n=1 Tax=candidate division KSB3 bacterium TaxID=2044937 RepID=A0A2G6E4T5_9BACT|nr:MAG: hypothetical protein CSB45_09595 [candidate division KSB3 bacterium]
MKKLFLLAALCGAALVVVGCDGSKNSPTANQNSFPSVQGIQISPHAAVYVDDTITLTPETIDLDGDEIRYTWSKNAGTFSPVEAVGPSIKWTAPSTAGSYEVTAVGDDGNGGTSQKHIQITTYGGNQQGTVDVVGGVRVNPIGELSDIGYIDKGDTLVLTWDTVSPVTTDGTRPDETRYAPDGSRLDAATLTQVSVPQYGSADGLPSKNAARYSVIGKIGDDGDWFDFSAGPDTDGDGIPNSFSVVAPERGKAYLSINEQNSLLVDNTGYWRFTFSINHP